MICGREHGEAFKFATRNLTERKESADSEPSLVGSKGWLVAVSCQFEHAKDGLVRGGSKLTVP
eukprot:361669-Rhodomonas_salina.3